MSNTPHQLHDEFPQFAQALHDLKTQDAHFARLAEEYQEVNGQIHRAETDVTPISDAAMTDLRKRRGALRDQIFAALKMAQPTS
ncbi:YdcH family protein [Pseudooceanicola algae]|uniref:DUF465 domain-containing protein n=1 Tax=Pseudooceanicola algae TaxID=1537215 RepID=A0A418SJJ6_9RHOB|nr:YdcH family protein [Pseudooceanicola algae]QPM91900.1 hypothetical protein PSAL_031620 [Pseudooceanicola algae]